VRPVSVAGTRAVAAAWYGGVMASTVQRSLFLLLTLPVAACGDDAPIDTAVTTGGTVNTSIGPSEVDTTVASTPTSSTSQDPTGDTPATVTGTGTTADPSDSDPTNTTTVTSTSPATTDTPETSTTTTDTGTTDATMSTGDTSTGMGMCAKDTLICDGDIAKVCDGMGGYSSETPCAKVCNEDLGGCVECNPGDHQCAGDVSQTCTPDGLGWVDQDTCDALQGIMCDPDAGQCVGACAGLGSSYIGCDYYPVVTQQYDLYVNGPNPWAAVVANTTPQLAKVTVTRGAMMITTVDVQPNSVQVIQLPWVNQLALGTGPTVLVADGAYRLRSTQPVTVYQFNPLNADVTNDASLMLPVNTWTGNYLVAAWQNWDGINLPAGTRSPPARTTRPSRSRRRRARRTPRPAPGSTTRATAWW
jgi:hypothetical protein